MKRVSPLVWLTLLLTVTALACSLVTPGVVGTAVPPAETPAVPGPTSEQPTPAPPLAAPQGVIAYASDRDSLWQVIVMNADGSSEAGLTAPFGAFSRPSWSPDGTRLGLRMDQPNSGIAVMDVRSEGGVFTGSQPLAVSNAFSDGPSWSPDGRTLAYSATQNNSGWLTFTSDIGTGETRQLIGIPENSIDPVWSPDGTRLVFAWYTDPSKQIRDIYLINADGSGMVNITNSPTFNDMLPAWSPDGSRIAFSSAEYRPDGFIMGSDLYLINTDGSNLTRLTTDPYSDFDPAWSPDGTQLAFASDRNASNDSNYEIYLINADGSGEMRLTNNHFTDRWPSWRASLPADPAPAACQPGLSFMADVTIPPGTRFALPQPFSKVWRVRNSGTCTWTPAHYRLQAVDETLGGGQPAPMPGAIQPGAVVDLTVRLNAPEAPGPYNAAFQLVDGNGQPVPNADGDLESLSVQIEVLQPGQAFLPQPFYFIQGRTETPQLWRMETDARTLTQVTREPLRVESFAVAPDGRIAFVAGSQLILVDHEGGSRQVAADGLERFKQAAWSPDGLKVAYAKGGIRVFNTQTSEDTLILADNDTGMPGLLLYEPAFWSPDGSKLVVHVYQWESGSLSVISALDGGLLVEFPLTSPAWSRDSASIYYAGVGSEGMMSMAPGLWVSPSTGGKPETLISDRNVWWPTQAPDGTLYYFIQLDSPLAIPAVDFAIQLTRSDASGSGAAPALAQMLLIQGNDPFSVSWSDDANSFAAQLIRPALGVSEVLAYSLDGSPPLFLMREAGQFAWGH